MNTEKQIQAQSLTRVGLSVREVAELLGVSARFVWKLNSSGRLPRPFTLGRCVRWSRAEFLAWVDAGCPPRDQWELRKRGAGR